MTGLPAAIEAAIYEYGVASYSYAKAAERFAPGHETRMDAWDRENATEETLRAAILAALAEVTA